MVKAKLVMISVSWYGWDRGLMVHCCVCKFGISVGMWDCNWIFLMGVWLLIISGRGLSIKANVWTVGVLLMWKTRWWSSDLSSIFWEHSNWFNLFSFDAGFLPMVYVYRHVVWNGYGLWITCCSYDVDVFVEYTDDDLWIAWCSMYHFVYERSHSFSLFRVLPLWFYLERFFKEETFCIWAAIAIYSISYWAGMHVVWRILCGNYT